jgi:hypothetical protein
VFSSFYILFQQMVCCFFHMIPSYLLNSFDWLLFFYLNDVFMDMVTIDYDKRSFVFQPFCFLSLATWNSKSLYMWRVHYLSAWIFFHSTVAPSATLILHHSFIIASNFFHWACFFNARILAHCMCYYCDIISLIGVSS